MRKTYSFSSEGMNDGEIELVFIFIQIFVNEKTHIDQVEECLDIFDNKLQLSESNGKEYVEMPDILIATDRHYAANLFLSCLCRNNCPIRSAKIVSKSTRDFFGRLREDGLEYCTEICPPMMGNFEGVIDTDTENEMSDSTIDDILG